ncbi:MAG: class I SAM-dependent rRNA methyltransferase [Verrucomicrobia bacterium]|nr:class I SAM-dependent rRNA methyltransferase [Verrucomicrobiota bacterium]
MKKEVVLKPGKEKSLLKRHPWIFSGAIASLPSIENGEVLPILSSSGQFLAKGYFHGQNSISGRVLTFSDQPIEEALSDAIDRAIAMRKSFFAGQETNCFRLINAEGDGLPGLIVDQYEKVLVVQINTCGMELLKGQIIEMLVQKCRPQAIYEKSTSSARRQEGLVDFQGWVYSKHNTELVVQEHGALFQVSLEKGQKTGFFLDQREMRKKIGDLSQGKRVLNCFSYSGGFSIYALRAGAKHVTSVDCSADALKLTHKNTELNQINPNTHEIIEADVFDFLRKTSDQYDLIILDPPAFAKKRGDQNAACSGYKEINRLAFELLKKSSFHLPLLLTCSCSHFIDEGLFQNVVFQASIDAGCDAQVLSKHIQSPDHPISLAHPEGGYLKSLLLKL